MATPAVVPRCPWASVTGKPILFASNGEGLKDFEVFHPDRMASRILDMGDIMTLIEQAQKQFDEEEARKAAEKISEGSFGLDDFLDQLQQVRKLGSMKSLLGMIPGMAQHRKELEQFDEREIDRHRGDYSLDDPGRAPRSVDYQWFPAAPVSPMVPA